MTNQTDLYAAMLRLVNNFSDTHGYEAIRDMYVCAKNDHFLKSAPIADKDYVFVRLETCNTRYQEINRNMCAVSVEGFMENNDGILNNDYVQRLNLSKEMMNIVIPLFKWAIEESHGVQSVYRNFRGGENLELLITEIDFKYQPTTNFEKFIKENPEILEHIPSERIKTIRSDDVSGSFIISTFVDVYCVKKDEYNLKLEQYLYNMEMTVENSELLRDG